MKNLDGEIFVFEYVISLGDKNQTGAILAKNKQEAEDKVKKMVDDSSASFFVSNFEAPITQNITYGGTYITPNYGPPAMLPIPNDYPFGKYTINCANS